MIRVLALALAWAAGMDDRRVVLLAVAVLTPLPASLLIGYAIWKGRRHEGSMGASFCEATASELRAGSSLRRALEVSARSVGLGAAAALAAAGADLRDVSNAIGRDLPEIGPLLTVTLAPAQRSGARVADLFDEIGSLAIAEAEIAAEVNMSTAPVRATVAVLAAAPVAFLAMFGGRSSQHVPGQDLASLAGALLFLAGLVAVVLISRVRP
jgi:Flp pilus assembly protein TadB